MSDSPENASFFAREIISRCVSAGIDEFIFCPGARDAPLAVALDEWGEEVRVWTHFDERSAAFFALGRCMALARPVAVITTSGTAAAELLPACIEAHYQARPLLLITADRPNSFLNSGAPQSIDQRTLFQPFAEPCLDLSAPAALFSDWLAEGPMHINLRFHEPLFPIDESEIPEPEPHDIESFATRPHPPVAELARFLSGPHWQGLVLMIGGLEPEDRESVFHFVSDLRAPVIADPTSGLRELLIDLELTDGDRLLKANPPRKILRLGEVPCGRFWRDLESLPEVDVFSITPSTHPGLARSSQWICGPIAEILSGLGPVDEAGDALDLLAGRDARRNRIDELIEAYPDSEAGLIRSLSIHAALGDLVYLGNSLPIRDWGLAAQRDHSYPLVRANRGANGIDGQISTFLGHAADGGEAWALLGDLTTLYDLGALAMEAQLGPGKRVVAVMNNGGGRIFDRLPGLANQSTRTRSWIRQKLSPDFSALATLWGCQYRLATSAESIDFEVPDGLTLLELRPCAKQSSEFQSAYSLLK